MFILRLIGRLPSTNPTLAAIFTSTLSVTLIIAGFSSFKDTWLFLLGGRVLLVPVSYIVYDTRFFTNGGLRQKASLVMHLFVGWDR